MEGVDHCTNCKEHDKTDCSHYCDISLITYIPNFIHHPVKMKLLGIISLDFDITG